MFNKKNVFVKNSNKITSEGGDYQWLINFTNDFFCYSRHGLELNKWYEIIYYQGKNGYFRITAARLVENYQQKQQVNQFNQQININNIFIMERQKHSGDCCGDKCYECWIVANHTLQQYQEIIKERNEYTTARENFSQQERELTNGYLFLNGKEVKHFTDLKEAEQWKNSVKKDVQWSFANLNYKTHANSRKN